MDTDTHTRAPQPMGLGSNILNAAPNTEKGFLSSTGDGDLNNEKDGVIISIKGENDSALEVADPFAPFPEDPGVPEEDHILTIRAVVLGCICGAAVNASNVYLGISGNNVN